MSTIEPRTKSTRQAILDAAVQLFSEQGLGIRLEDIARKAGVSRQSVYVHFGSRTGLLIALVQHVDAGGMLDSLMQQVLSAPTALDALDAVVQLHAEYSPVAYPVARVLMTGRHEDEALQAAWDDRMSGRRNLYRFVVQWLERDGLLLPEWEVEAATEMVWALTSWQVWEQLVIDQSWPKERYLRYLSATLRRALADSPGQLEGRR